MQPMIAEPLDDYLKHHSGRAIVIGCDDCPNVLWLHRFCDTYAVRSISLLDSGEPAVRIGAALPFAIADKPRQLGEKLGNDEKL